jgi:hypothetical protein
VVAASLGKFRCEAAAPSTRATPMGSRGEGGGEAAVEWSRRRGGKGGKWEWRPTLFFKATQWRGRKGRGRGWSAWARHATEGEGRREWGRGLGSRTTWSGWLRAALSEATARARGGGGLANRGGLQARGQRGAGVTDRWDRGEVGPSGQRPWCERERERGRAAVGRRHAGLGGAIQT